MKKELFEIWKLGKTQKHVSEKAAYEVAGVTENDNMSTHPRFKPGAYFYPMLKIHKVRKEELIPGVEPPARLVTSLRDGVAKRSDVFIADRFLKTLEKDYCKDLLADTSDALRWLDSTDQELDSETKKKMNCFTFDFKALYDSLEPNLVMEAVRNAMNTCRPDWSTEFKDWIISLIDFSLRASVAKYDDSWWRQNNGIPTTGGSLCVQLANITVYYVMLTKVYSVPNMMADIKSIKRFIDDGGGFHFGNEAQFHAWLAEVNRRIGPLGLHIDESSYQTNSQFINLLDVQYCFDIEGKLQTDLYVKETDSRSYLNFSSAHPNHTFSGNVYSQSLRLRRIINDDERLRKRLKELSKAFKEAGYPEKMVTEITNKVQNSARNITTQAKEESEDSGQIIVVSTFEADKNIVDAVKRSEDSFKKSFRAQRGPLFKFVKKVGPNIRCQVNSQAKP